MVWGVPWTSAASGFPCFASPGLLLWDRVWLLSPEPTLEDDWVRERISLVMLADGTVRRERVNTRNNFLAVVKCTMDWNRVEWKRETVEKQIRYVYHLLGNAMTWRTEQCYLRTYKLPKAKAVEVIWMQRHLYSKGWISAHLSTDTASFTFFLSAHLTSSWALLPLAKAFFRCTPSCTLTLWRKHVAGKSMFSLPYHSTLTSASETDIQ